MESTPPTVAAPLPRLSRRIVSAVSVTGFGSVFTMLFNTLTGMVVAHNTGPAGYAVYVAANMLVFISAAVCDCGMSVALAKYVAGAEESGHHDEVRGVSSTVLCLMLLIGLAVGGVVSLNLPRLEHQLLGRHDRHR